MIVVGDARIEPVLELALTGRPIAWLGAEDSLIEASREWLAPHFLAPGDLWTLNFQTWLVRHRGKSIVIDPCSGNDRPHPVPAFDMLDTPFIERFEATGTRVDEIDYVFCTHLHHDHCGWNTRLKDGRWVPTFPNARYLLVRREYERWDPARPGYRPVDYNAGVFERSILPIVEAGLVELTPEHHDIMPGLRIEFAPGHTLGHAMLRLHSAGEEALFSGDAFHHPLQLTDPTIQFGDCDDIAQAIATRRQLIGTALAREALVIPAHLPFPHAGFVEQRGDAIRFRALESPPG